MGMDGLLVTSSLHDAGYDGLWPESMLRGGGDADADGALRPSLLPRSKPATPVSSPTRESMGIKRPGSFVGFSSEGMDFEFEDMFREEDG